MRGQERAESEQPTPAGALRESRAHGARRRREKPSDPSSNTPRGARVRGFFFSSRRRHTRFDCDWSSDVCSSDLGSGRLIILNDGMDGGAGGNGGPGGPGAAGGPGADTQCKCEASSCAVSSCLGSILPETGAAGVDDPVIAQSMAGYLKLMQDAKILQSQPGRESMTQPWLQSFQICTPTTTGSNGEQGAQGGAGGTGGAGGNGGTGGNVAYVPALQGAFDRGQIVASISGGVGGKPGKPGDGGDGGLGGPGGMKGCEQQSRFELGDKGDPGDRGKPGAIGANGKPGKVYVIQD